MKILSFKYVIPISFIILVAILYLTFIHEETQDEKPDRAILVIEEVGGWTGG